MRGPIQIHLAKQVSRGQQLVVILKVIWIMTHHCMIRELLCIMIESRLGEFMEMIHIIIMILIEQVADMPL